MTLCCSSIAVVQIIYLYYFSVPLNFSHSSQPYPFFFLHTLSPLLQLCTPQSLLKSTTIVLATKSSAASNNGNPSPPIVFPKVNVKVSNAGEWCKSWF